MSSALSLSDICTSDFVGYKVGSCECKLYLILESNHQYSNIYSLSLTLSFSVILKVLFYFMRRCCFMAIIIIII